MKGILLSGQDIILSISFLGLVESLARDAGESGIYLGVHYIANEKPKNEYFKAYFKQRRIERHCRTASIVVQCATEVAANSIGAVSQA